MSGIYIPGMEIWKPIPEYPRYSVSNMGRISNGKIILKPTQRRNGYLSVTLCNKDGRSHPSVHRLVANAFVENPNPQRFNIVNHKDENKTNNEAENLEWCDTMYNTHYGDGISKMRQRRVDLFSDRANNWRCIPIIRVEDGKRYSCIVDAAEDCNIDRSSIAKVCRGERKTAGGYHWKSAIYPAEEGE